MDKRRNEPHYSTMDERMNQVEVNLPAATPTPVALNPPIQATDLSTIAPPTIATALPNPVATNKRKSPIDHESTNPNQVKPKRIKQSDASTSTTPPIPSSATTIETTGDEVQLADAVDPEQPRQAIIDLILKSMLDPKSESFMPFTRIKRAPGVPELPMPPPEPIIAAITVSSSPINQMPLSTLGFNQHEMYSATATTAAASSIPFLTTPAADPDTPLHIPVPMRRVQSQPLSSSATAVPQDSAIAPTLTSSISSSTSPMSEEKESYVVMILDCPPFCQVDAFYRLVLRGWLMGLPINQLFNIGFEQQNFGKYPRAFGSRNRTIKRLKGEIFAMIDPETKHHVLRKLATCTELILVELKRLGYKGSALSASQTNLGLIEDKFGVQVTNKSGVKMTVTTHTGLYELVTRFLLPSTLMACFVRIKGLPKREFKSIPYLAAQLNLAGEKYMNLGTLFDHWINMNKWVVSNAVASSSTSAAPSTSIGAPLVNLDTLCEKLGADGFHTPIGVDPNMTPRNFVVLLLKVNMLVDYVDSCRLKSWLQLHLPSQPYVRTVPAESHPSSSAAGPKPTLASIPSWSEDHPVSHGTHMVQPNYSSSDFSPTIKHSMAASSSTSHSSYLSEHLQPPLSQLPATLSPFRLLSSDSSSHAEPLCRESSTSHFPSSSLPPSLHFWDPFSGSAMMSAAMPINSQFTSPTIHFPQIEDHIQLHHDLRDSLPLPLSPSFSSLSANDLPSTPSSRPPTPTPMDEGYD